MASVVLSGDTSGSVTIAAPAVAGSNTQTLVAATGTLAPLISGTAVTASSTSVDFTSIPSWAKRITVMLTGVSTSGTSNLILQLGTGSTTYTTTGYLGACGYIAASSAAATAMSTGFMFNNLVSAANVHSGILAVSLLTGNTWSFSGNCARQADTLVCASAGSIPLAAALTAVRITTVNGTDTFDAGTINILYE
jgi:hypothetical protein